MFSEFYMPAEPFNRMKMTYSYNETNSAVNVNVPHVKLDFVEVLKAVN